MLGLLVKDYRLMLQRKRTLLTIIVIAMFMVLSFDGMEGVTFICVLGINQVVASISYDEFDHGYTFLMSLPISRTTYVKEKYIFGALLAVLSWILGVIIAAGYGMIKIENYKVMEEVSNCLVYFPFVIAIMDIVIPFMLKYGVEKGRTIMLVVGGGCLVLAYVVLEMLNKTGVLAGDASGDYGSVLDSYAGIIVGGFYGITLLITVISVAISIRIMKHKEF